MNVETLAVGFLFFIILLGLASLLLPVFNQLWLSWSADFPQTVVQDKQEPCKDLDALSLRELGLKAAFGDTSDQGAVDVAIKIRDLQLFQQQAKNFQLHIPI